MLESLLCRRELVLESSDFLGLGGDGDGHGTLLWLREETDRECSVDEIDEIEEAKRRRSTYVDVCGSFAFVPQLRLPCLHRSSPIQLMTSWHQIAGIGRFDKHDALLQMWSRFPRTSPHPAPAESGTIPEPLAAQSEQVVRAAS